MTVAQPVPVRLPPVAGSTASLRGWGALCGSVAVLAFLARLLPVLRGGGLFGLGDYDDGVHYSAAVAVLHGRLPYRDFLFLHPPGIVLALLPFAALGHWLGDPAGFAAARLAWMLLGAVNAVLGMHIVRRQGRGAALLAGLCYALFPPAIYGEHSTQLEGLGTACILLALLLLTSVRPPRAGWVAVAGGALAVSTSIKIWGLVAVLIALVWVAAVSGRRRAGVLVAGALGGATAVCLPFFLAAPAAMYRMVVRDQLGRPAVHASPVIRLAQIVGLPGHPGTVSPLLVAVGLAFTALTVLAWRIREARLTVVLLLGLTALLMLTPSWFLHYSALVAGPAAVTVGFGSASLLAAARRRTRSGGIVVAVVLGLLVAGYVVPDSSTRFGSHFPGNRLAAAVSGTPGCITSDNPTVLVEMDVLSRNLDRGCPLVIDLGGRSYDDREGTAVARDHNSAWQRYALAYLKTGTVVVIARFSADNGFSPATAAVVAGWPVIRRIGHYRLRRGDGSS